MITLRASLDCKSCHGSGTVTDNVPMPFGSGSCGMDSDCECPFDNADEEQLKMIDDGFEYQILPAEGWLDYIEDE